MRACVAIPSVNDAYPFAAVIAGLKAIGCEPVQSHQSLDADFLVNWSPWKGSRRAAIQDHFERAGKPVIVMENGWLSPIKGCPYFQVALGGWNGTGRFFPRNDARWHTWGMPMLAWKQEGATALIIGQRGHPFDDRSAPPEWHTKLVLRDSAIIRRPRETTAPLARQLEIATEVHVWTSNAASWAILHGVPVVQHGPNLMVAAMASKAADYPMLRRGQRLPALEHLAWAQWNEAEITSGLPFKMLLAEAI